jgi:hypothetical protein
MKMIQQKKGQVTIFIILAIALVIILAVFFLSRQSISIISSETPIDSIKKCSEDATQEALDILTLQGGAIEPSNYYLYEGNKVDFICYTEEDFKNCLIQKPLLKQEIENEIKNYISQRVNSCIQSKKVELQDKGYTVNFEEPEIQVEIFPNNILVNLNEIDLTLTKGETQTYANIKTDVNSKLYDLIMISSSIANWESKYGDVEIMNYMIYYPFLIVKKLPQEDGVRIYTLTNKKTNDEFMFASKSMTIPPGVIE